MTQYYFTNGQDPTGPFTIQELSQLTFTPESLIWHAGIVEWQPATAFPELKTFLAPTPPPVRREIPTPPPPSHAPAANPKPALALPTQAPAKAKIVGVGSKALFMGGAVAVVFCLLLWAFPSCSSNDGWKSNNQSSSSFNDTNPAEIQQAPISDVAHETAASVLEQAEQQRQAALDAQRERDRAWSRAHFIEFVNAYPNNDHSVGTFGGISAGTFTVANAAGYRLRDVIFRVNYYTPSGNLINTSSVSVSEVPAKSQTASVFPSSGRGVRVDCQVIAFSVPGLDYKYDIYVDETDIGNPN